MMSTVYQTIEKAGGDSRSTNATRLFVLAFIGGALYIGLSEWLLREDSTQESLIRASSIVCPLVIMLIYYVEGRKVVARSCGVTIEQLADSLYFLGFLYTLCALLVALMSLGENYDGFTIVPRFGLALITTIVGLFSKIALTQFQITEVQVEDQAVDQARTSLVSAMDELTETMSIASRRVDDFVAEASERFASGTGQCIEILQHRSTGCADALDSHLKQSIQYQAEQSTQCIEALHDNASNAVEKLHSAIDESTRQVAQDYENVVGECMARRQEMSALIVETGRIAKDAMRGMADDASSACEKLGEKTQQTNDALGSLADTLSSAGDAQRGLLDRVHQMDEALQESTNNRQALNEAVMQVAGLSASLSKGIGSIVDTSEAQQRDQDARQAALMSKLEQMIQAWRQQDTIDRDEARVQLAACLDGLTSHMVDESGKSLTVSRDLHMALQELLRACQTAIEQQQTQSWWSS